MYCVDVISLFLRVYLLQLMAVRDCVADDGNIYSQINIKQSKLQKCMCLFSIVILDQKAGKSGAFGLCEKILHWTTLV